MSAVRRDLRNADRLLEQAIGGLDELEALREREQELRATLATVGALIEDVLDRPRRLAVIEGAQPERSSLEAGESTVSLTVRNAFRIVLAVHEGVRGSFGCHPDLPDRKLDRYLEARDTLGHAVKGLKAARRLVADPSTRDPPIERPLDRFVSP